MPAARPTPPPTILLTRPVAAARATATRLRTQLPLAPICISPLVEIEYCGALPDLAGVATLIFTSMNGVAAYVAAGGPRGLPCFAVGPATAQAAREAGLTATAASGTAETLVALIGAARPTGPLLHIRGTHARGDVAGRLTKAGIQTDEAILYRQSDIPLTSEATALLNAAAPVIVPLFSPRTAMLFARTGSCLAPLYGAAMSNAVAAELNKMSFESVVISAQPDATSMIRAIQDVFGRALARQRDAP